MTEIKNNSKVLKKKFSLEISEQILSEFHLEVQKKHGFTHNYLGLNLEEALLDWIAKRKKIRKNKKRSKVKHDSQRES